MHASGGEEMLRAVAQMVPGRPLILGGTVLTSMGGNVQKEVLRLAKLAQQCGLSGVVASPQEIGLIRKAGGEKFLIVIPGIRPSWAETGDQKRVMTPTEAVAASADYIIVGRLIIAAPYPITADLRITTEMTAGN